MKEFLFSIIAALGVLALPAHAQDWQFQSFLTEGVTSITVSNATMGVTNLSSVSAVGGSGPGTNVATTTWTNVSPYSSIATNYPGIQIVVSNTGSWANTNFIGSTNRDYSRFNLLRDVPLWVDKPASAIPLAPLGAGATTNLLSYGSLIIKLTGGSGANSAVTFRFLPLWDGTNQSTASGDIISVAVTANTTTPVVSVTPLRAALMLGAKALRLVDISNADTDASSAVNVLEIGAVGFHP